MDTRHRQVNCSGERMINVILAERQGTFRVGLASLLAAEEDIRVIGQPRSVDWLMDTLEKFQSRVLVLSSGYLNRLEEINKVATRQQTSVLLLAEPEDTIPTQFHGEIQGVIQRSEAESIVAQCVRHLARGGKVLRLERDESAEFSQDFAGIRVRQRLSLLERRIMAFVVKGYSNREIAFVMDTTEQDIKTLLRRIFDMTGVCDRFELALFVLHNRTLAQATREARPVFALNSIAAIHSLRESHRRTTVN
jgi:DNA-binding NarL/FixJ family response regulator